MLKTHLLEHEAATITETPMTHETCSRAFSQQPKQHQNKHLHTDPISKLWHNAMEIHLPIRRWFLPILFTTRKSSNLVIEYWYFFGGKIPETVWNKFPGIQPHFPRLKKEVILETKTQPNWRSFPTAHVGVKGRPLPPSPGTWRFGLGAIAIDPWNQVV